MRAVLFIFQQEFRKITRAVLYKNHKVFKIAKEYPVNIAIQAKNAEG